MKIFKTFLALSLFGIFYDTIPNELLKFLLKLWILLSKESLKSIHFSKTAMYGDLRKYISILHDFLLVNASLEQGIEISKGIDPEHLGQLFQLFFPI